MPQDAGWCNAPDAVEGVAVQAGNGGYYYNVTSRVHDLPNLRIVANHISLVSSISDKVHVTWELVAVDENGTQISNDPYDAKLYHWFNIDSETGSHSVDRSENEYGSNYANLVQRYAGLPDDIVDADSELQPYSAELMEAFAEEFAKVNP
ncbi:MAG: hypothetical protein KGQ66_11725 [Acidobacteriota bacterium]|nr:hypothetical protein [Acidobacteriota bacterium]